MRLSLVRLVTHGPAIVAICTSSSVAVGIRHIAVTLITAHGIHNEGETASFELAEARKLITDGVARSVDPMFDAGAAA